MLVTRSPMAPLDELPQSDDVPSPAVPMCLCCPTLEPPVVTLTTDFVHYLRCSACGFIWTIRATQATQATLDAGDGV